MPRNPEIARAQLRHAAIELFAEKGFDAVTAAEIAARAGVTERTFFRHFPDKREVLFDGQAILAEVLDKAIAGAPAELSPMAVLRQAFDASVPLLEANRPYSEPRQKLIAATPALKEREAAKHTAMVRDVADALRRRGVESGRADLAAQAGMAVFSHALAAWFADASLPLGACIDRAFGELFALTAG